MFKIFVQKIDFSFEFFGADFPIPPHSQRIIEIFPQVMNKIPKCMVELRITYKTLQQTRNQYACKQINK
jgi:hypothetical protein